MTNPIAQYLNQNRQQNQPNNPIAMISKFRQFAAGMTPKGAKQQVEQMLSSGQISKEQFEQYKQQANEFMKFLK